MFKREKPAETLLEELREELVIAEAELEGVKAAHDIAYDRVFVTVPKNAREAERSWVQRGERDEVVHAMAERIRAESESAMAEFQSAQEAVTRAQARRNELASRVSALDHALTWEEKARRQGREAVAAMEAVTRSKAVRHG